MRANTNEAKYTMVFTYTKTANLMPWWERKASLMHFSSPAQRERMNEMYSKPRKVELQLRVRFDEGKTICRINCPINPLPVKGEFEAPMLCEVQKFLTNSGWDFSHKTDLRWFK